MDRTWTFDAVLLLGVLTGLVAALGELAWFGLAGG